MSQTVAVQGPEVAIGGSPEVPVDWKAEADKASRLLKNPGSGHETPWEQQLGAKHYEGKGVHDGKAVAQDFKEAVKWYTIAAAGQNNVEAQFNLAVMYHFGRGVIAQDYGLAFTWYCRAAGQGDPTSQFNIGTMYANGEATPKNPAEAAKWFWYAAVQGHADAQFNLGCMYYEGSGVIKDMKSAMQWFTLAAHNCHSGAQFNLGSFYINGHGVKRNPLYAYAWFNIAASSGLEEAVRVRDTIEGELTVEQLEQAQNMARCAVIEMNKSSCWQMFRSIWGGKRWWSEGLS
ncbi:MAG TPA: hypothetical protein DD390_10360 [Rhodospirillaceae bacterium]|nr:hypothetical protein [Rhodospirillaceae bacterium]MAX61897.1 hypothetical protein [Rhodospirillaceae bacterium]HBM13086.1 hypothetical protein [Rhodospirillaceae bacterium]|tara:strand:- start:84154 stop:85020 length:867 start_codon:yes stop_codon:yes gene_type:complete